MLQTGVKLEKDPVYDMIVIDENGFQLNGKPCNFQLKFLGKSSVNCAGVEMTSNDLKALAYIINQQIKRID